MLESTRTKEAEVSKQTRVDLEAFRVQQGEAEKAAKLEEEGSTAPAVAETWSVGPRKRKKAREGEAVGGIKFRKTSTAKSEERGANQKQASAAAVGVDPKADLGNRDKTGSAAEGKSSVMTKDILPPAAASPPSPPAPTPGLGLVAYSSDEDD